MNLRGQRGWVLCILALAVLAGVIRWAAMAATFPVELVGDEKYYASTARNLASGEGYIWHEQNSRAAWPPGQSYLLSLALGPDPLRSASITDGQLRAMLRLQIVVGTLLVLLTAQLAHAFYGRNAGLAAGVIAAVYPTWIAYSHYLWSETLFTALVTGGFVAAVYGKRRGGPESWILAATAGVLFGAAALTRELGLVISAVCALWWVVSAAGKSRQRAIPHALVVVALSVVVILPWTIRNYQIFNRFVPVSTVGWMAIREGNTLGDDWLRPDIGELRSFRQRYFATPGEMNRMEFARRDALDLIRSEQPVWLPKKVIRNLALLFSPDSFLFKKISRGSYDHLSLGTTHFLLIIAVTSYLVVIALGFMGQLLSNRRDPALLTWMIFAAVIAVHVVANSGSRYRFPLMPLLMISAAALLSNNCMRFNKISSDRRLAAAIGLGMFIWLSCAYFFPDAISLWERGAYLVPDRP